MKRTFIFFHVALAAMGSAAGAETYDPLAITKSVPPSSQDYNGSLIGGQTPESRLEVYPRLPDIPKYELVLYKAEHSAFTDRALPGDTERRNPNHHRVILALSTAFWDAHLRGDAVAREWLHGGGARAVLEKEDRWQFSVPGGAARRGR